MPKFRLWHWLSLLGLVSLALRVPLLTGSFWLDEAAQALEVVRPWHQQLSIAADFQPPLFHLILHLWQYLSHEEWWLRLVSVIAGVGSILVISALSWQWQGKRASMAVGLLLATSSLHVFFSQELRPYMLAVFWGAWALLAFWTLLFPQSAENQVSNEPPNILSRQTSLGVFTLANLAGALSSYVYLFFLGAFWLSALWQGKRTWWLVTRSLIVTGLFWLAWLPGLLDQLAASAALRLTVPGWENVVSLTQAKSLPLTMAKFWVGLLPIDLVWQDALVVIIPSVFVSYLVVKDWQSSSESAKKQSLVLLSLLLITLVSSWLFSFWTPVISPKRVLFLLPVLYLLLGQGVQRWAWWGLGLWAYVLTLNGYSLYQYWQNPALQRENWRAAIETLESRCSPHNTVVVFGFDAPFSPWEWYEQEGLPTRSTGFKPLTTPDEARLALEGINQYENVVLFDYLLDLSDPARYLSQTIESKGYQALDVLDYPNLGFIRLYYQQKLYAGEVKYE